MGDESEISTESTSRGKQRRAHFVCHCGEDAPLMTSWTNDNPGQRFYGCGRFQVEGKRGCGFFRWYDPEVNQRDKKIIRGLLRSNN